jgi:hypothetical protein
MKWSQQKRSNRTSFWNEKKKGTLSMFINITKTAIQFFLEPVFSGGNEIISATFLYINI